MSTSMNVKIPDGLAEEMDDYVTEIERHMNTSELVREAIRQYLDGHQYPLHLTPEAERRIEQGLEDIEEDRTISLEEYKRERGFD